MSIVLCGGLYRFKLGAVPARLTFNAEGFCSLVFQVGCESHCHFMLLALNSYFVSIETRPPNPTLL